MSFNQWENLFNLNPNRYNLDKIVNECSSHLYFSKNNSWNYEKNILISFSFIDYIKFLFFVNNYRKEKNKQTQNKKDINQNEALKYILETAQSDIEKMKKQSQKEIEKAVEAMNDSKNLGKVRPSIMEALEKELDESRRF